jgi:uncharacterized membrane protein (DUF485 family)
MRSFVIAIAIILFILYVMWLIAYPPGELAGPIGY